MSDMSAQDRLQRSRQAETELSLTGQAFVAVRSALLEAIAASPLDAQDARERLYLSIGLLEKVRDLLTECVNDGAVARNEIELAEHFSAATQGRAVN